MPAQGVGSLMTARPVFASSVPKAHRHRRPPLAVPRLHIVTDTRSGRDPLPVVRAALTASGACDQWIAVQVRAKQSTDREVVDLTRRVLLLARPAGALVLVNDRLDLALAAGADGVHLGADDLPIEDAARLSGPGMVIGATVRHPQAAVDAGRAGAAYLGVGPVFGTATKKGLPTPFGAAGLRTVISDAPLPVLAIGGVNATNIADVMGAGAHGAAVVTAVSDAADPQAATARLLRAVTPWA
jgi:thiamine-phosphate pyrophosphorylase